MAPHTPPFVAQTLALALVRSSAAPVLLLDGSLTVLAASASFCMAFQIHSADIIDRVLMDVGDGEWDIPQLAGLLKATASGHAAVEDYEMNFVQKGAAARKLVVTATKLEYVEGDDVRLILTVSDVTEARAAAKLKQSLLHDKDVLLQEIHHRVANSLQIIASVLMQSARTVQSEETRLHLTNAHQRVMSVASLQRQLAATSVSDVDMRAYLTNLCQSIGASMIADHGNFSLTVRADDSKRSPNDSVSIGLIVTELVINALKHAFAGQKTGKIFVDYHSVDAKWTLAVTDNGVGMPVGAEIRKGGLGTSIVQALAAQLGASIVVSDARPGTEVSISHTKTSAQVAVPEAV